MTGSTTRPPPRGGLPAPVRKPQRRTQERLDIAAQAKTDGITPLEVMLDNMRYAHGRARLLTTQMAMFSGDIRGEAPKDAETRKKNVSEWDREALRFRNLAQSCAADAAPYVHPRLASLSVKPPEPEGGQLLIVEGGLPRRASDSRKPTDDEVRGILEGTTVDVTPEAPESPEE